jgi:uncharacterized protein (DUF2236 family)
MLMSRIKYAALELCSVGHRGGKIMNVPTQHDTFQVVCAEDLERELNLVREAASGLVSGIFGPQSVTWHVNREAAIFLGAGRALLLQLAHPWIAAAIEQHSDTFDNPIGRFHRTFIIASCSRWCSERSIKA